jgi:hypothetical protein
MSQILNREVDQNGVIGLHPDDSEFESLVRGKDGSFAGNDERGAPLVDEGDIVKEVSEERGERRAKGRGRRIGVGVFVLFVLAVVALGTWYLVGNGAKRKAKVAVNGNSGSSNSGVESEAAMTQRAIDQAGVADRGVVMPDGSVVRPAIVPPTESAVPDSNLPVTQMQPAGVNPDLSSTVNSPASSDGSSNESSEEGEERQGVARTVNAVTAGRNKERSVIIAEELKVAPESRPVDGGSVNTNQPRRDEHGIVVPSFGSMLPVKSLGVLYTLRSGGLVRFELSRDVKGKGWSMPKGTVLVGVARGAEYNRAFVSLVGFIDTESGHFVKVGGELLGSDGGAGIRGERRKMSSSWSRVFAKLGEASLRMAEGLAGSFGRRPIVISDAFGSYGRSVTNELDGALLRSDRDRNSFVEVAAGSQGYMMITDLPDAIHGVDALSKLSGADLKERSDVNVPREVTGLAEQELAELIQSGDVDRIKAALPRMSAEMRRVAEAVIGGDLAAR